MRAIRTVAVLNRQDSLDTGSDQIPTMACSTDIREDVEGDSRQSDGWGFRVVSRKYKADVDAILARESHHF